MPIWVDGDACPNAIKAMVFRAAVRTQTLVRVVANRGLNLPPSPYIKQIQVSAGFDAADQRIVDEVQPGDLVITADIPLADAVISKGGLALNPRGELYTHNNMKALLAQRNANESLRGAGLMSGGPSKFSPKDLQRFANHLDKYMAQQDKPCQP